MLLTEPLDQLNSVDGFETRVDESIEDPQQSIKLVKCDRFQVELLILLPLIQIVRAHNESVGVEELGDQEDGNAKEDVDRKVEPRARTSVSLEEKCLVCQCLEVRERHQESIHGYEDQNKADREWDVHDVEAKGVEAVVGLKNNAAKVSVKPSLRKVWILAEPLVSRKMYGS